MLWEDKDYDVADIVKKMVPPVGMRQEFRPGEGGFLEQDLTAPIIGEKPRTAMPVNVASSAGPQRRLEQLESMTPTEGKGALPITVPSTTMAQTTGTPGAPQYNIPSDMMSYFDNVVKTLTGPSAETEHLKNISQGFGIMGLSPKDAAQARIGATKALADIEGIRRNAATNLANTLSHLMVEPSKFNLGLFGKQMEYDLGRRGQDIAARKVGVEEMKAPWEIRKLSMAAPETVSGLGPGGVKTTYGWTPEEQQWKEITRGALPVGVREGEKLIEPTTGQVIAEGGEKAGFKERLGQTAFKAYEDEMKNIENDLRYMVSETTKPEQKKKIMTSKSEAQKGAWEKLSDTMKRLGYGEMFGETQTPKENEIRQGQFGKYIRKNGRWQVYQE